MIIPVFKISPPEVVLLVAAVVLDQLVERDGLVVVHLDRRVEDALVRREVGKVVGVRVAVDVAVDHVPPHAVVVRHHRVVAEGQGMCAVARLQHRVYALEVAGEIDRVRPRAVVVAEDERLASVEPLQQTLRVLGAEE